jgi:hypothetical protein
MSDDPTRWGLVLKVRNVDREVLVDTLSTIAEVKIRDIRET